MYEKPMVISSEDMAEGVFMASGACYTASANIHQTPETGRGDYRIQVNGHHDAADGHHCAHQVLTISFNQPVSYSSSNGQLRSGDGSTTLVIDYAYHQNAIDNIGLGDVVVTADPGLAVTGVQIDDADYQTDHNHE